MQLSITSRHGGGRRDTSFFLLTSYGALADDALLVFALLPSLLQMPVVSDKFSPLTLTFVLLANKNSRPVRSSWFSA